MALSEKVVYRIINTTLQFESEKWCLINEFWGTLFDLLYFPTKPRPKFAQVPDSLPHISPDPDAPGLSKFWVDTDTPITVTYTDILLTGESDGNLWQHDQKKKSIGKMMQNG